MVGITHTQKKESMHDPFDRRIGFIGVALVFGGLKHSGEVWKEIKPPLDHLLRHNNIFEDAPFLYVQLAYRYGIKNNLKVDFLRINKRYGDLPLGIELNMEILMWADKNNVALLRDIFMVGALEALIQVCEKYKLAKIDLIKNEQEKYYNIPDTIEKADKYGDNGLLKE